MWPHRHVGLRATSPFIATPRHRDGKQHGYLSSRHNVWLCTAWPFIAKPRHRDGAHHGYLSSRYNMGCAHATTWDCVHHEHSLPRHGIGMMPDNMMYRHWTAWDYPINSRGTHAERRGRGYPEGVILLIGQGWWAQRNLPCLTTFATECYPFGGCTCLKSLRNFHIDARFCDRVNHDDATPRMVTCDSFDSTLKESTTPKGVAFHTPRPPG